MLWNPPAKVAQRGRSTSEVTARWHLSLTAIQVASIAIDFALIILSAIVSYAIYDLPKGGATDDYRRFMGMGVAIGFSFTVSMHWRSLYQPTALTSLATQLHAATVSWCLAFVGFASLAFLLKVENTISRDTLLLFLVIGLVGLMSWRCALCNFLNSAVAASNVVGPRVLILADSARNDLNEIVVSLRRDGYRISRTYLMPSMSSAEWSSGFLDQTIGAAVRHVRQMHIDEIIVVIDWARPETIRRLGDALSTVPISVKIVPNPEIGRFLEQPLCRVGRVQGIFLNHPPMRPIQKLIKRVFDIFFALLGIFVLLPLAAIISVAIAINSPGPVLFRQWRGGYNGRRFQIFKFRTMVVLEDGSEIRQAQRSDPRVTRVGRFLRKYSIDEFPQLINVLYGEMSLIGPRPHALIHDTRYSELISPYSERYNIKPGITGLAQVSGCRGETADLDSMRRRVEFDIEYIREWSIWLDIRIVLLTVKQFIDPRQSY